MTEINAHLNFNGQCREAMTFYQECLGGELFIQTVGQSPMGVNLPPETRDAVVHARLDNGSMVLLGSDMMGQHLNPGNNVTLTLNCDSAAEIQELFAKLAEGGVVSLPLSEQFWGAMFGALTDKYGFTWMLNFQKEE